VAFDTEVLNNYKDGRTAADADFNVMIPVIKQWFGIDFASLEVSDQELLQRSFLRSMKGEVVRAAQESVYLLYGGYEPFTVTLTHLANQAAGVGWTSYSHTGVPVPTYALGAGQRLFDGYYDNTDIFRKLAAVMGLKVPAVASAN
jgi:alkaline phosphatase